MTKVLRIDASARSERSRTRALADAFGTALSAADPTVEFMHRDVGLAPPPFISEDWIAAAFTDRAARTPAQAGILAVSDQLIEEVRSAEIIVVASPMYNYGMPAALKAWFDQVIRVNETFSFDLARGDHPLEPTLAGKTLILLTSVGEFGFTPGGINAEHNHLEPHLRTVSKYLGVCRVHEITIEYQEFGDERHASSIARAHEAAETLAAELTFLETA